jgi:hypothetical protein
MLPYFLMKSSIRLKKQYFAEVYSTGNNTM